MNIKLANKMKNFRRTTMRKKENIESSSSRNLLYFCKSTVWNKNLSTLTMQESLTPSSQSAKCCCVFFLAKRHNSKQTSKWARIFRVNLFLFSIIFFFQFFRFVWGNWNVWRIVDTEIEFLGNEKCVHYKCNKPIHVRIGKSQFFQVDWWDTVLNGHA